MNSKNFNITYLVGLLITSILMIFTLLFWINITSYSFLIFFWILKFLSGFGLVLSIANGFLIILEKTKNKIGKRGTNTIIIFQIVIPLILIIFALYNLISSYTGGNASFGQSSNWSHFYIFLNDVIYLYGIMSLILSLFIFPIIKDQFEEAVELGKLNWWKKSAKRVGRNIKKKYFKLKKEYAKAHIQDQMTAKEILNLWRNKFAINLLLVFAIGTIVFTPIAFVFVMYWLRLYVFYRNPSKKYENIAMLLSMIWIGIIACLLPFVDLVVYQQIEGYLWTMNIWYLIGIILASWIFIKKILNLQQITLMNLKIKRKEGKIDKQEEEIQSLKEELKQQKGENNQ